MADEGDVAFGAMAGIAVISAVLVSMLALAGFFGTTEAERSRGRRRHRGRHHEDADADVRSRGRGRRHRRPLGRLGRRHRPRPQRLPPAGAAAAAAEEAANAGAAAAHPSRLAAVLSSAPWPRIEATASR
ncbi:MAG: hypothetical protein R2710_11060 [Acidimicrobiales bacterium]